MKFIPLTKIDHEAKTFATATESTIWLNTDNFSSLEGWGDETGSKCTFIRMQYDEAHVVKESVEEIFNLLGLKCNKPGQK